MEADGFGVSVDLSHYFSDERARCWVWVPRAGRAGRRARRVRWLAARLRRRLRLPAPPALLAPAGLLLPADPLALLQPGEHLRAIPGKSEWFQESDDDKSLDDDCETNHSRVIEAPAENSVTVATTVPHRSITVSEEMSAEPTNTTEQNNIIISEGDTLQLMKKRALALLDNYDESFQCTSSVSSEGAEDADVPDSGDRWKAPSMQAGGAGLERAEQKESEERGECRERRECGDDRGEVGERRRRRRVRRRPRRAPRELSAVSTDGAPQAIVPIQEAAPPVLRNSSPRAPAPRLVRAVCSAAA